MTKINLVSFVGCYLPHSVSDRFIDADGRDIAEWMEREGYSFTEHGDAGRFGFAITKDGIRVTTNGYVSRAA